MKKKIMLLDENGMFIRSCLGGAKHLALRSGECVGGVFTMTNSIMSLIETFKPDHIISCTDSPRNLLERKAIFPNYKENRNKKPGIEIKDFKFQKDSTKAFLNIFKIPRIGLEGFEADDIIATLTKMYKAKYEVIIVSGDKDMFQLLDANVKIVLFGKYNEDHSHVVVNDMNDATAKFGCNPKYSQDLQALAGDTVDNIPGVKGIGETSATKMVNKYGTLENIFNNLEDKDLYFTKKGEHNSVWKKMNHVLTQEEIESLNLPKGTIVKTAFDMAKLSRELTRLRDDVQLKETEEQMLINYYNLIDRNEVKTFFEQMEFETLILKMGL